ncbi:MAG TPA: sigma-54 dependent transcriptional regulator [Candidatus Margulisiibacteriota bacterium]|nr:sigma-54 dependent transcriptional regulator [Candidatus Margulisiibacteriota bacterium]
MDNGHSNGRHILIVDDEPLVRRSLGEFLTLAGYTVSTASNGKEALHLLKDYTTDIVITDIKMPEMDGIELLKKIKSGHPGTPVILITSYGSIENAVDAIRQGAYDYITKPIIDSEIKLVIERLINQRNLQEENKHLKEQLSVTHRDRFHNIVGKDEKMQKLYTLIEAIINTRATVLINGESGTGKRLVAHAIHKYNEHERGKPFVEVSCGALTETLLESELFGHVKGAFTGAIKDRAGRFETANGGTIFLDEIDAFSPALQVKLLRVLQDGEFERVGETKTIKVDVRVIAATNQKLEELIAQGKFRKDLFYRLNIISIELPPLRERKSDIPLLANEFIHKHAKHINKKIEGLNNDALSVLMDYNWPGNIRELENVIERAIILCKGPVIEPHDFPDFLSRTAQKEKVSPENGGVKLKDALKSPEKDLILKTLESVSWSRNDAAKALGINRTTLYKKMLKYGLLSKSKSNAGKE